MTHSEPQRARSRRAVALSRRAFLGALTSGAVIGAASTVLRAQSQREIPRAANMSQPASATRSGVSRATNPPAPAVAPAPAAPLPAAQPPAPASQPSAAQPAPAAQSPAAQPPATKPDRLVMLIRHGEKPDGHSGPSGLDAFGHPDKHSLTRRGWSRSHALVGLFDPPHGPVRGGLARPEVIYAAGVSDEGEGSRTRETVRALAAHLGIPVNTQFSKGDEAALARRLAAERRPVLVCWQHGEIPVIADGFNPVSPAPPSSWPDDRYDMVWTFTPTGGGWSFDQVPELVLSGDSGRTFR